MENIGLFKFLAENKNNYKNNTTENTEKILKNTLNTSVYKKCVFVFRIDQWKMYCSTPILIISYFIMIL